MEKLIALSSVVFLISCGSKSGDDAGPFEFENAANIPSSEQISNNDGSNDRSNQKKYKDEPKETVNVYNKTVIQLDRNSHLDLSR